MNNFKSHIPNFIRYARALRAAPRQFCRWAFTWRIMRRVLLSGAILATIITAFYQEERWRGRSAWEAFQSELDAQGVPRQLASLAPPPVPDDQNFAMTPLLKPLSSPDHLDEYRTKLGEQFALKIMGKTSNSSFNLSWIDSGPDLNVDMKRLEDLLGQTDLLAVVKKFDPELAEISAAVRRPAARFPIDYNGDKTDDLVMAHIIILRQLSHLYTVRALAELAQGQADRASNDVITIFRLAEAMTPEPEILAQANSTIIVKNGLQVLWNGLASHHWSDSQLAAMQGDLQKMDYIAVWRMGLLSQQVSVNEMLEKLVNDPEMQSEYLFNTIYFWQDYPNHYLKATLAAALMPSGWLYRNWIILNRDFSVTISAFDAPHHRVDFKAIMANLDQISHRPPTPYNFMDAPEGGVFDRFATHVVVRAVATIDQAQVACALERYRLAQGGLPEKLNQLVPQYIAKLPNDIISGGPLHYMRQAKDQFFLYSISAHGVNHGGKAADGDYVWPSSAQDKSN